ncbi:MAG: hypothetical protein ACREXR_11585, partial [Gammaproteobacteria bacterium]
RGRNIYDAYPVAKQAQNFDEFEKLVLSDNRSTIKGQAYICAPMSDGHRCRASSERRAWLPFDFDEIPVAHFPKLLKRLEKMRGFAYTTASHTADNPRLRAIVQCSREADREEMIRVGKHVGKGLNRGLQVKMDESVFRAEQPCFLPLQSAVAYQFAGTRASIVDISAVLDVCPPVKVHKPCYDEGDGRQIVHSCFQSPSMMRVLDYKELFRVCVVVWRCWGEEGRRYIDELVRNGSTHSTGKPLTAMDVDKAWMDVQRAAVPYGEITIGSVLYVYDRNDKFDFNKTREHLI